jgi:hypothetical protein
MNREERLRAALPGADHEMITRLGALPAADVAAVVAALRLAHREGRAHEVEVRRQRVRDRRKYKHIEDEQHAAATGRQVLALARRARSNLDTLAMLKQFYDDGPQVLALAVAGARAQGYSDTEIGNALECTRAAVGQRFGRKGDLYGAA